MLQLHRFFERQRFFYRNQRARGRAARQLLQVQTFLSKTLAQRNFRQCRERVQVAHSPAIQRFEKTGGFFLRFAFEPVGKKNFYRQ